MEQDKSILESRTVITDTFLLKRIQKLGSIFFNVERSNSLENPSIGNGGDGLYKLFPVQNHSKIGTWRRRKSKGQ